METVSNRDGCPKAIDSVNWLTKLGVGKMLFALPSSTVNSEPSHSVS